MALQTIKLESKAKTSFNWFVPIAGVLAGILVMLVFDKFKQPDHQPSVDTVSVVAEATRSYVHALADCNDVLADAIESGEIRNREQLLKASESAIKAARKEALMPIAELDNTLPEGSWDSPEAVQAAVTHIRLVAKGHREAIQ